MIGELNRRITIETWDDDQDEAGGVSAAVSSSYTMWAQVEERNGIPVTGNEQQIWNYDYRIKVRYERTRVIKSNKTILYDGKRLSIGSISFKNEGNRRYAILRCSTTDNNV